jgi:endonuclease YncB( thermonuclease family)
MATGLLELTGQLQVDQFWPNGESDGDTIVVSVASSGAFKFRPHASASFHTTNVFYNAKVRGKSGSKPPVDVKKDGTHIVHIRLQGIDSAELHYMAHLVKAKKDMTAAQLALNKKWNHSFRQHYGESAAAALGTEIAKAGSGTIPCKVTTAVDEPNEVFDTYARMVGDVFVTISGQQLDVNQWMVANGWAYTAFYTSMSKDEIQALIDAAKKAAGKGIWKNYSKTVGTLDPNLVERRSSSLPAILPDTGSLLFPKLFRRQVEWTVNRKIGLLSQGFGPWLKAKDDKCYLTKEFLASSLTSSSLTQHQFSEFVPGDKVNFKPQDLVFSEEDSTVVRSDGKPITDWGIAAAHATTA